MDGLQSLHDGGVPPKLLVIDDGQCPSASPVYHCPARWLAPPMLRPSAHVIPPTALPSPTTVSSQIVKDVTHK